MVELTLPTVENIIQYAALAQLVEQGTENPCVLGSIPRRGIFFQGYVFRCNKVSALRMTDGAIISGNRLV